MSVSDKDSLVVARSERTPPAAKPERTPADKPLPPPERLALNERTQRAMRPMSADRPYHPPRRISPLTRRILFFNAFALFILIGGVLWVQSSRAGLVQERIAGIRDQALIVAGALAEYTADPGAARDRHRHRPSRLLRQLIAPTHLRARVYTTERPAPDRHAQSPGAQHRGHRGPAAAGVGQPRARLSRARAGGRAKVL